MNKLISIIIAILLIITAIPMQIYLHWSYLGKIASISQGYNLAVSLSQIIAIIAQMSLSVAILFKINSD